MRHKRHLDKHGWVTFITLIGSHAHADADTPVYSPVGGHLLVIVIFFLHARTAPPLAACSPARVVCAGYLPRKYHARLKGMPHVSTRKPKAVGGLLRDPAGVAPKLPASTLQTGWGQGHETSSLAPVAAAAVPWLLAMQLRETLLDPGTLIA